MQAYHLRRKDKAITLEEDLIHILSTTRYVTVSMCSGDEPYSVILNHGYDRDRRCLYFHCAPTGKKIDILKSNPHVWGIALVDHGYQDGKCDHAYSTVMFAGEVTWVTDSTEKRTALEVMIEQQESDPRAVMEEQLTPTRIDAVTIGRINVTEMSGKQALPE
ncbi:MAG: hypothetical protein GY906_03470 [bacterium]|nr:hypothetical protein [bacterium]